VIIWTADSLKLFISHVAAKKEIALKLKDNLAEYSISAFVAHSDVERSAEWQTEIENA
jgi:hypothetical protein